MLVRVNGDEIELPEGSTIKDAIKAANAPYLEGCVLSVIKGKEEFERYVNKYKIKTTKGSIIIELLEKNAPNLIKIWKEKYNEFVSHRIRWTTSNEISIGPIKTELKPTRDEQQYQKWDVILSLSGFTADATHVIFSKTKHKSVYGTPEENNGIFGKVIGGKRTIYNLDDDDQIKEIKPVIERSSTIKSATITDLNTAATEGNEIFTYLLVKTEPKSPISAEHFFALADSGKIQVDYDSNSFVGFYNLQGIQKNAELIDQRKRGTVTLRNGGLGSGRVYMYREDRVSTPTHTVLGHIDKGIQLLDIANVGDYIKVESDPQRIMTLKMTQKEAEEFLSIKGIEQIREGLKDDDAVIVVQDPKFTMDILKEGKVKTHGVNKNEIIEIEIFDSAPRSSWYFKKHTGLIDSPIGYLKVHFAFPGMKVMMFEPKTQDAKGLIPENTPKECINAGLIGVTNMSRRHVGMIGVRFENNDEFGPTGEPFTGTNIIGKVIKGLENLEKFKEGDIVYVTKS